MRCLFFLFAFPVAFFISCGSGSSSSESGESASLSNPVVSTCEESGPFGDASFVAAVNSIAASDFSSSGDVFYISPNGSDSDNGSENAPFKTFSHAIKRLSAGNILYVKGGSYYQRIELPSSLKGDENSYITIAADPKNENPAVISGINLVDDFRILTIDGASYVRISGLSFSGADGLFATGVLINPASNHIIVDNCSFTEITVPEPEKEDHVSNGIICYGSSATASIDNILLYGNSFSNMTTGWGECVSVVGNCQNVNIIKNTIDETGNIGIDVGGNYGYCPELSLDFARYVYIAGNDVSNCESPYGDTAYGIYADGGQHIQIEDNSVSSCSGGIEVGAEEAQLSESYATYDVLLRNNRVSNCEECALAIGGYETDCGLVRDVKVVSNTFTDNANSEDGAIIALSKCKNISITNNTFTQSTGEFLGCLLYYSLSRAYSRNIELKDNTLNNVDEEVDGEGE